MALVSVRLKGWWGSADVILTDESVYDSAEVKALGASAQEGEGTAVRRVQSVFTRAPAGSTEDVAVCTMDFMNMTGGEPDDSWTAGDFAAMETLLDAYWTTAKINMASHVSLTSYRWYRIGPGIAPPNPAVRITTKSLVGGNLASLPPQVAISITEKTAVRRSWGRWYVPGIANTTTTIADATGRIHATTQGNQHTAAMTLMDGAAAADFLPVVYSRTRNKVYGVEKIQVDDLFDVQRPRRWDKPLSRLVGNVGP
jgi:hypothetical protein